MPTAATVPVKMAQRRDTAANWTSANPTLLAGEIGIESDTNKIKIGNGSTAWTSLGYRPWSQVSAYPLVNADIASAAAIAYSKLATLTSGNIVLGSSANVATSTAVTGDVTISNTGVTAIASGVIVNADVNASAAIAGTKISPDFGSQATVTTGTNTAASFIPTSNSIPSNGIYLPGANQVAVATNGSGRLFVDASGNVGVNETTPLFPLVVRSAGTCVQQYKRGTTVLGYIGEADQILTSGLTTDLAVKADGNLVFGAGSLNERLRITSAGLVGIGSSSPVSKINSVISQADNAAASDTTLANSFLHLGGGEYGINRYFLTTYGYSTGRTNSGAFIGAIGASASGFGKYDLVFGTRDVTTDTAPDTRMIIKTDGKVGIGVTSPAGSTTGPSLDVNGPLFVRSPIVAHQTNAGVLQYTSNETSIRSYGGAAGSGQIVFNTGGGGGSADAEAVRIDSSRRLLVGTSSTAQAATAIFQGYDGVSTNPAVVRLCRGVATPADGDPLGYLTFGDSGQYSSGQIAVFRDGGTWTSGTSMPTRLTFSTTADGGSSPTERLRITSTGQVRLAGAGITFNGDTAAANELDDYEEGTFTPTVGAGITINSGTPAYSGFYTKIGRMVHITISQTAGNITATVGAGSVFTGLPFTPGTLLHACSVTNGAPNISGTGSIYNSPGTGVIYIGFTATSQTNLTFTGTYFV